MRSHPIARTSAIALAMGCAGLALPAASAEVASADPADSGTIEEVVVTAQKRVSTAQKTAAAITVFDNAALEKNNVGTLQDLSKLAPGVNLAQNSAVVVVTMRGVASRDTNEIGDPAVSISSDGFYVQRPTGLSGSVFDLERVEVLRGPQGTLYGRSATGGAINFITAKPTSEFAGRASVSYGNFNALRTEGMINLPLNDAWAARVSFATSRHSGYRTNEDPARAGDDDDTVSARAHLQFKPSDQFRVLLTAQYQHTDGVGPTVIGVPIVGPTNTSVQPYVNPNGVPHGLPNQWIDNTTKTFQLSADYNFGFAQLIYQGGYRDMKYAQLRDLDGRAISSNYFNPDENPRDISHELRLVSSDEGRFRWQIGGYFFQEKNSLLTYFQSYAVANPPQNVFTFSYDVLARSKAVFGQASYEIVDGLTLDAGARYSEDLKRRSGFQNTGNGDIPLPGEVSSDKITYHVGLNWQATPANLLYGKFSTGYKAGGFSTIFLGGVQSGATVRQVSYDPETIEAFEVGSKNQFFGRRLQLNVSAFSYNYKDQQLAINNGGVSFVANAGKSRIYGAEAEFQARPTPVDSLDGSIAYLHAELKEFCAVRNVAGVCTSDFAGRELIQSPEWQINFGYEHVFEVPGGTLTPRLQTHYESRYFLGIDNTPLQRQDAFWRSDAMVTFDHEGGRWSVQAFVRNLEDVKVLTNATTGFGSYLFALTPPRTYGLKLTASW